LKDKPNRIAIMVNGYRIGCIETYSILLLWLRCGWKLTII